MMRIGTANFCYTLRRTTANINYKGLVFMVTTKYVQTNDMTEVCQEKLNKYNYYQNDFRIRFNLGFVYGLETEIHL